MVDVTEISAIVAAAGVLVGVAYYILDMRHQNKIRRTDLDLRLYSIAFRNSVNGQTKRLMSLSLNGKNN